MRLFCSYFKTILLKRNNDLLNIFNEFDNFEIYIEIIINKILFLDAKWKNGKHLNTKACIYYKMLKSTANTVILRSCVLDNF